MLGMNSYLDRLFQVWTDPDGLDEMEVRLAEFYTDPVRVNGSDISLSDLARRARALHATSTSLEVKAAHRPAGPWRAAHLHHRVLPGDQAANGPVPHDLDAS